MMSRGASFDTDQASRQLGEERKQLHSPKLPPDDDNATPVDPMNLKDRLRDVQPDRDCLIHALLHLCESLRSRGAGEPSTASIADLSRLPKSRRWRLKQVTTERQYVQIRLAFL